MWALLEYQHTALMRSGQHGLRGRFEDEALDPLEAYVNHGRWVVECECHGAQRVDFNHPVYFCLSCENRAFGGRMRPIIIPENYKEIEAALLLRPDETTRNWLPGETVADLLHENEQHGIGDR